MSKDIICKQDGKRHDTKDTCPNWEPLHPAVAQARKEVDAKEVKLTEAWRKLKGFYEPLAGEDKELEDGLRVAINVCIHAWEKLHLLSYIHKTGMFAKEL